MAAFTVTACMLFMLTMSSFHGVLASINLKTYMTLSSVAINKNYPVSGTTDGHYGPFAYWVCMASSAGTKIAWWRGDFTTMARIRQIDIVFRLAGRADGYALWVSNDTGIPSGYKCYEDVAPGSPALIQNITCHVTGQSVMIYITRPSNTAYMDVCEVDVYGCFVYTYGSQCENTCYCKHGCNPDNGDCDTPDCQAGWYGDRCNQECTSKKFGENCLQTCHCKNSGCDRQTGRCTTQGCVGGYMGVSCSTECTYQKFGENCLQTCYCNNSGCDRQTGLCTTQGCVGGYMGDSCSTACGYQTFGENCIQTCHCKNSGCDPQFGRCITQGCVAGYMGIACNEQCSGTKFGDNCLTTCHCNTPGCHHVTGTCTVPGCAAGWKAESCNTSCATGEFGKDCLRRCHCAVLGCDVAVGTCTSPGPGCQDGWNGTSCSTECGSPFFGNKCGSQCNCKILGCNHVNGTCGQPECLAGWKGESCTSPCTYQMFGENCLQTCHCKNYGCDRQIGQCITEGCEAGYLGESCSTECPPDIFGENCESICHCRVPGCNRTDGTCSSPGSGCSTGYTGLSCSEACPEHSYGLGCNSTCGKCANVTSCHPETGICAQGCMDRYYGDLCNTATQPLDAPDEGSSGGIIGGSVGAVVAVCVIVIVIVVILKRRSQIPGKKTKSTFDCDNVYVNIAGPDLGKINDQVQEPEDEVDQDDDDREDEDGAVYVNDVGEARVAIQDSSIAVKDCSAVVETKNEEGQLKLEYEELPFGAVHPHEAGKQPFNIPKNRFKTTFPYDHSRVILKDKKTAPGSDYINANYIDSLTKKNAYLAVQGPKRSTVNDFWLMIWEQDCRTIVMLTNLVETGIHKCHQYWPEAQEPTVTPMFEVRLSTEKQFAFYTKRVMMMKHIAKGHERQLTQFHFTRWPDHGTPDAFELVMFHRHVQRTRTRKDGPLAVHCSAGIGRTGTFIALDALTEEAKKADSLDVFEYVKVMRKGRMNMIQTPGQYTALHFAISEGLSCPETIQTKTVFLNSADDHSTVAANHAKLKMEFQVLQDMNTTSQTHVVYETASATENRAKNRSKENMAADQYRQRLYTQIPGRTNYINAIRLPSHRNHAKYQVTQFPTQDTVVDFWTLMMDYRSSTIVCLGDTKNQRENRWWPAKSKMMNFPPYEVKCLSEETEEYSIKALSLTLKNKQSGDERQIKLFHVNTWTNDESTPPHQSVLCRLHYLVEDWLMSDGEGPVTVTCMDGAKCCGLYCLISTSLERLDMVSEVDIFATARQLQIRRPQFVGTFEQYRFALESLKTFLQKTENTYQNQEDEAIYQNS